MCVNFKSINKLTRTEKYQMSNMEELVALVSRAKYLSTVDYCRGYNQIRMDEASIPYTTFVTPFGQYSCLRMPFGLVSACSTCQLLSDLICSGCETFARSYLDDVVIFSDTWSDHTRQLKLILGRIRDAGITLKPSKCVFANSQVTYLGYVVGSGTIQTDKLKVEAVRSFPKPVTKTDVKCFLGTIGFYRKFIPHYATLSLPLTDMLSKSQPRVVCWNPKAEEAFSTLRETLVTEPILCAPNPSKPYFVQCDASERAVSAVLLQEGLDGQLLPCAYQSRKLAGAETRYPTIEKEALAIVYACSVFKPFLVATRFTLLTDHRPLISIKQLASKNSRIYRWSLSLEDLNFDVNYVPGVRNNLADYLSRPPSTCQ